MLDRAERMYPTPYLLYIPTKRTSTHQPSQYRYTDRPAAAPMCAPRCDAALLILNTPLPPAPSLPRWVAH